LTIPDDTAPGDYTLSAIGVISGAPVSIGITVSAPEGAKNPIPTPPGMTPSPTTDPTSPPEASPTSEVGTPVVETQTPEPTPNSSPIPVPPLHLDLYASTGRCA